MRTWYCGILAVLAFSVLTVIPVIAAPIVEFEKTRYDFGKTLEGEKTKAVFQFKNTGDTDLEITNVHAGCGCTQVKATETKVAPGKSAAVEAIFNTAGYNGRVTKSVTVTTNDSAHSKVALIITGDVILIAKLTPPTFSFGDLKPGASAETEVDIKPEPGQKFKILRVDEGKLVSVPKFDASPGENGTYRMKIKVTAGSTAGRIPDFEFADSVAGFRILPISTVNLFAIVLPWIELVCGLSLITGILMRSSVILLAGLNIVFIAAAVSAMARGLSIECGCFTLSRAHDTVGWNLIARDIVFLLLCLPVALHRRTMPKMANAGGTRTAESV